MIKLYNKNKEHIATMADTPENEIMLHTLYRLTVVNKGKRKFRVDSVRG